MEAANARDSDYTAVSMMRSRQNLGMTLLSGPRQEPIQHFVRVFLSHACTTTLLWPVHETDAFDTFQSAKQRAYLAMRTALVRPT